jgi:hypothetical protein
VKRTCESCGGPYEAIRSNARFCSERCKKRGQRGHLAQVAEVATDPAPDADLSAAVLAELEAAGRVHTAAGQSALTLARRIEAGQDTGSAIAALNKEMRATLAEAVTGANVATSALQQRRDELAALRAARRAQ